jgi:hypothetical protein
VGRRKSVNKQLLAERFGTLFIIGLLPQGDVIMEAETPPIQTRGEEEKCKLAVIGREVWNSLYYWSIAAR